MKAEEIRRGNLVLIGGKITDVSAIDKYGINGEADRDEGIIYEGCFDKKNESIYYGQEIQPIPLTEEWLVKLGAKKADFKAHIEYRIDKRLFILRGNYFHDYGTDTQLQYVHQLQNFYFALTGEELTLIEQ